MRLHRGISVLLMVIATGVGTAGQNPAPAGQNQGPAPGQIQGDAAKGATLIAEARKALGGEDKLTAITRLEAKGESRRAQSDQPLEGDLQIQIELPDKYLRKEELMIGGAAGLIIERVEALNGSEAWEQTDGGNFPGGGRGGNRGGGFRGGRGGALGELIGGIAGGQNQGQGGVDPERLREAQRRARQADFLRLALGMLLATPNSAVAWVGTAQSPDGTADVIDITPKDGQPMRLLLDTATHMPLMIQWQGAAPRAGSGLTPRAGRRGGGGGGGGFEGRGRPGGGQPGAGGGQPDAGAAPQGGGGAPQAADGRRGGAGGGPGQATVEMHLSEYKVVNGVKLPHVITRGANGEVQEEFEIKSYKINPNFKANTFVQPK